LIFPNFRLKFFGILSILSITALIVLGFSANSHSLWDSGQHHADEVSVNSSGEPRRSKSVNASDDFDRLAAEMATDWPRGSTVKQFEKQAVASDVTSCSIVGK
jgi:hypothetical protein